jgi:hypothetical protein
MKYMLLIHHNEQDFTKYTEAERQQMVAESVQLANRVHAAGQYVAAARLHPTTTARSVRVREGKRLLTDGPFAETREHFAGYFLVDVKDMDEAVDIASRIPAAKIGVVEVRPVMDIQGLPQA